MNTPFANNLSLISSQICSCNVMSHVVIDNMSCKRTDEVVLATADVAGKWRWGVGSRSSMYIRMSQHVTVSIELLATHGAGIPALGRGHRRGGRDRSRATAESRPVSSQGCYGAELPMAHRALVVTCCVTLQIKINYNIAFYIHTAQQIRYSTEK